TEVSTGWRGLGYTSWRKRQGRQGADTPRTSRTSVASATPSTGRIRWIGCAGGCAPITAGRQRKKGEGAGRLPVSSKSLSDQWRSYSLQATSYVTSITWLGPGMYSGVKATVPLSGL